MKSIDYILCMIKGMSINRVWIWVSLIRRNVSQSNKVFTREIKHFNG